MDDALRHPFLFSEGFDLAVLILILMDDALRHAEKFFNDELKKSLNPYFNG